MMSMLLNQMQTMVNHVEIETPKVQNSVSAFPGIVQ